MAVVANQTNRGPGVVDTGNQNIAAVLGTPAQPNTDYVLTALMRAADIADPALVIHFRMWLDGVVAVDNDWQCGTARDRAGAFVAPYFTYSQSTLVPTTVRVAIDLPTRISIGLDVASRPLVQ